MDTIEAISKRQSIRSFTKETVPQEILDQLIFAAQQAPSAGNQQPCEYIVCTDAKVIAKVGAASFQDFIKKVPALIVVVINSERTGARYGDRGTTLYVLQDSGAAIENILVAATALGYGSLWCGAFREEIVQRELALPPNYRPIALISVGKPAATQPKPSRRLPDAVVHWNKWP